MNKLVFFCLFFFGMTAQAVEMGGVVLPDSVHLGNHNLVLNGVGVRSKYIFDLYVVALYLSARKTSTSAVLADTNEKRIAIHLLREIRSEDLLYGLQTGLENNNTDEALQAMKDAMHDFKAVFNQMGIMEKGDVIWLDYLPGKGTRVTVNGVMRGNIPSDEFNGALLKIWLGEKPAQKDLKLKLLGGK